MQRPSFLCGLVVVFAVVFATPPVEGAATKTGWWVRIDKRNTETSISFQIGTDKRDRHVWTTWRLGDDVEFDMPDDYLQVDVLYIQAIANPDDKDCWFCVFYGETGVRHFDFDEMEDGRMTKTDRDRRCK